MSERQEHRRRLNARIAYAAAIERWAKNQPLPIRLFAIRRWLKEMPRKENFYGRPCRIKNYTPYQNDRGCNYI